MKVILLETDEHLGQIGDIVNVTHSSIGFSSKPFRVLAIKFNPDYTLGLDLVEHQNAHYNWN